MRPEALRPKTRKAAATSRTKLATRLTRGEVRHRKRMAEIGAIYDITPRPRAPADIRPWIAHLTQEHHRNHQQRYLNGTIPRAIPCAIPCAA